MIAALLGWTKLPQWALELIIIAAVAGGVWYWQHHLIEKGIAEQVAKDTAATKKLQADTDLKTKALEAKATTAETNYANEHQANLDYQRDHPPGAVRLCRTDNSGAIMSSIAAAHPGDASTGAAAADVPKVPGGNSGSGAGTAGPDIGGLLGLLALKADDVSGTLREFQSR